MEEFVKTDTTFLSEEYFKQYIESYTEEMKKEYEPYIAELKTLGVRCKLVLSYAYNELKDMTKKDKLVLFLSSPHYKHSCIQRSEWKEPDRSYLLSNKFKGIHNKYFAVIRIIPEKEPRKIKNEDLKREYVACLLDIQKRKDGFLVKKQNRQHEKAIKFLNEVITRLKSESPQSVCQMTLEDLFRHFFNPYHSCLGVVSYRGVSSIKIAIVVTLVISLIILTTFVLWFLLTLA